MDTGYTGTECLTFSTNDGVDEATASYPAKGDCASGSSVVFSDGLATANVTLPDAGTTVLQVTDNSSGAEGTSGEITVTDPAA